ncbi:uncharacterized protein G2W53_016955 [Senna tora]|uniref:Uncharacterized protein n=1 Tax=Senna tora TaxID=362788 RepID=A0A834TRW7_9FABA|nr:uncharacterized protein G2W53_016955 [Senna tora]
MSWAHEKYFRLRKTLTPLDKYLCVFIFKARTSNIIHNQILQIRHAAMKKSFDIFEELKHLDSVSYRDFDQSDDVAEIVEGPTLELDVSGGNQEARRDERGEIVEERREGKALWWKLRGSDIGGIDSVVVEVEGGTVEAERPPGV